jgi:hypothetical protein
VNEILETKTDLLNLLSKIPDNGEKLYFQFEYGEAQTARNRGYSNPRIYWLQKEGTKFNMQGGYSPACFADDVSTIKRKLSELWNSAVEHNEIFTQLDPLDIANFKIHVLSRNKKSWVSLQQLGGSSYAFTTLDDIRRFEKKQTTMRSTMRFQKNWP